jgi:hypothetical protein
MLRPAVICFFLVYFNDDSWKFSMDVVIHPLRCGLAIVLTCRFEQGEMWWRTFSPSWCVTSA